MKIGIISNFKNRKAKNEIVVFLKKNSQNVVVFGFPYNIGTISPIKKMVSKIKNGEIDFGIFVDNFGVAPFIIANKFPGIICATAYDKFSAKMSREHNNANIICFATKINSKEQIVSYLEEYMKTHFQGERHKNRVNMMLKISGGPK